MNVVDLVAVVLLVFAVVVGYRSGALPQIGGLAGALAGAALALLALPLASDALESLEPSYRAVAVLTALLLSVGVGEAIGSSIARLIALRLGNGVLGALDRVAGAFVGVAQAVLVVWLAGGLLAAGPTPRLAGLAQGSLVVRTLNGLLPAPTEIAVELGRVLDASGLPDVFVGIEPLPAAPVDLPDSPLVRQLAAAAEPSTVKVSAATCDAISSGTGFVVAPGYVVTNAHVLAGGRVVRVASPRQIADAEPVLFDPSFDVAVLYVPGLSAPALRFAATDPDRGAIGAGLGYPGGGALKVIPVAVAGRYAAQGRDIYGESRVARDILELHAEVDRGDSGGPFILADGTVGGMVFAESRTNSEVGYALTPTSVAVRVAPALGRTGAVATGDCIR